jgi:Plasmid pRiA4b ORF-3-like protein
VARTWLQIKIELVGGLGGELDPPPGRVFAVGPSVSFERFAEAINVAFGRWDFSHLHRFELAEGQRLGFPDLDFEPPGWVDHAAKLGSLIGPGDEFVFVFDFGDDWRHECRVLTEKLDPREEFGEVPRAPVVLWGWGWLPDQYGRETDDDAGSY